MNYSQLVDLVKQYTQNEEASFVANIPSFTKLAEQRIYNAVFIPAIQKTQVATLTANNKYLTVPTDWLANFSLAIIDPSNDAQSFMSDVDISFIRECYPNPNDIGIPIYYAIFDESTFILGPTPDSDYQVELNYYHYPESIVTAGTTWLGDKFDSVLLYGTLREAYIYMKGEQDMMAYYEQKYQESLGLLKLLGEGKNRTDAFRDGINRIPVT